MYLHYFFAGILHTCLCTWQMCYVCLKAYICKMCHMPKVLQISLKRTVIISCFHSGQTLCTSAAVIGGKSLASQISEKVVIISFSFYLHCKVSICFSRPFLFLFVNFLFDSVFHFLKSHHASSLK